MRAAYRRLVKTCHPDQFQDPQRQKAAQEQLLQLNLAYEAALKLASQHRVGFNLISQEEAKHFCPAPDRSGQSGKRASAAGRAMARTRTGTFCRAKS